MVIKGQLMLVRIESAYTTSY